MDILPYPPAPEPGWYAEDNASQTSGAETASASPVSPAGSAAPSSANETAHETGPSLLSTDFHVDAPSFVGADAARQPADVPVHAPAHTGQEQPADDMHDNGDIEDWDSTVLSSSFTAKQPHQSWLLHNEITGQTIVIDKSTLLGRKPSMDVPEGAKSERIIDPTRTTSRNHAAISIDQDGKLWIEDYGSLNGTFIIHNDQETQVKDKPFPLESPATLRIGDQFFQLTEQKD